MELTTIEMSKADAEVALQEWESELRRSRSEEDAAIVEGYRALSLGKRLIRLSDTIRRGGEDGGFKPRLAVAPTQSDVIFLDRRRNGDVRFCTSDQPRDWTRLVSSAGVLVEDVFESIAYNSDNWQAFEKGKAEAGWSGCRWRAMVPIVPPRFRHRGWKSAHVLFEAEWATHSPPAPIDPALIRHLRGDLWVVTGVWDLTELERAVLLERNS